MMCVCVSQVCMQIKSVLRLLRCCWETYDTMAAWTSSCRTRWAHFLTSYWHHADITLTHRSSITDSVVMEVYEDLLVSDRQWALGSCPVVSMLNAAGRLETLVWSEHTRVAASSSPTSGLLFLLSSSSSWRWQREGLGFEPVLWHCTHRRLFTSQSSWLRSVFLSLTCLSLTCLVKFYDINILMSLFIQAKFTITKCEDELSSNVTFIIECEGSGATNPHL